MNEHVIFTGFIPDDDMPYIYKLSRCFIIASIAELLSLATLQAMASRLPVIAVKAGALVELIKENINGYLYEEGDIPAIVKHIKDIITREDLYQSMSENSLTYVQKHDINKTLESFENLYQDQIGL